MYENVHPSLALVLLFVRIEVECRKGLLFCFRLSDTTMCHFFLLYRPSKFRDDAEVGRETSQLPSAAGTQGLKRNAEGRGTSPADFVTWDAGNSTGFDADTSKV